VAKRKEDEKVRWRKGIRNRKDSKWKEDYKEEWIDEEEVR
jgi:hypothetical protein